MRKVIVQSVLAALSGTYFVPNLCCAEVICGNEFISNQLSQYVYGKKESTDSIVAHSLKVYSNAQAYRLYAAYSGSGSVSESQISVEQLTLDLQKKDVSIVAAGFTNGDGNAVGNVAKISNVTVHDIYGGRSKSGSALNNQVIINEKVYAGIYQPKNLTYGYVVGGLVNEGTGEARGNIVTVAGNQVYLTDVIGGEHRKTGVATQNQINISKGHITGVYGGSSSKGDATENTVLITGGIIASKNISDPGCVYGGMGANKASKNRIEISGGKIVGSIIGGSATNETIGNTVMISGSPDIAEATLIGGNGQTSEGNVLILKTSNLKAQNINHFQKVQFDIDSNVSIGTPLLTLTDAATELNELDVLVTIAERPEMLVEGDQFILLKNGNGINIDNVAGEIQYDAGTSLLQYDWALALTDDTLAATVTSVQTQPEIKAFLETNLSRLALVNQGGDLMATQAISASHDALSSGQHLFVAYQAGSNHYETGSFLDLDSHALIFGAATQYAFDSSALTLGAFFETGKADYEAHHLDFVSEGETQYRGGGIFIHWNNPWEASSLYTEASLRLGRAEVEHLPVNWDSSCYYDIHGNYYAAHIGLGYRWHFNDATDLDLYSKFFYTHQDSEAFSVNDHDVQLDSLKSKRWRNGIRFSWQTLSPEGYVFQCQSGLAYEYEFDAKAKGAISDVHIPEAELQGGTGIGEFGVTFFPSVDSNFSIRAKIEGFVGNHEGVVGEVQLLQIF